MKVDQNIHIEVLSRKAQFNSALYSGFVNPIIVSEFNSKGEIIALRGVQPTSFEDQMINYSENYSLLPLEN